MSSATDVEHVNSVFGPNGFTDTLDDRTVDLLIRLGLIEHHHDQHLVVRKVGDEWIGDGPIHRFYAAPGVEC